MKPWIVFCGIFLAGLSLSLSAQTHVSVPVDSSVYYILEQAQMRGLCAPLPGAKPYSQAAVRAAIDEILAADDSRRFGKLSLKEREFLQNIRKSYEKPEEGLDLLRGAYYYDETLGKNSTHISADMGFKMDVSFSEGMGITANTFDWGFEFWPFVYFNGDIGDHFSFGVNIYGGILRSPRDVVGTYNTYYEPTQEYPGVNDGAHKNTLISTYSQPLSYFPYAYKKHWDGFVWNYKEISNSGQLAWPEGICIGYSMLPELGGSFLDGHLTYRAGRLRREWGGMSEGSSLVFNQTAQPFVALETTASLFPWFSFSSLTGVLEYYNENGITTSAETSQNAYSIGMVEVNYKNYAHVDFGSTVVWAKRFELGYLFPLVDNFLYQNNIGDFDNMAYFLNMKGQYPGIGNLWLSFFLDEINPEKNIFELDRSMFAYQAGTVVRFPWLSFGSFKLSYTKIEPYCYTHTKGYLPWYGGEKGGLAMETSYTNNGESIGSYLPPNSDELLLRFETVPGPQTGLHFQYQMIRHGADYGPRAVDGSSLLSELDPSGRSEKPVLRKYFLKDGAYQWMHIFKIGAEHALPKVPVRFFGEFGVVISYFTDIDQSILVNSGSPSSYSITDNPLYPKSTRVIATVGIRLFP
ncbi:MAG: hypothetical protein LBS97_02965 [Treponema sp.]|jgi:hypothetical protein|nr:hypothetical protein [Treponema sp.]